MAAERAEGPQARERGQEAKEEAWAGWVNTAIWEGQGGGGAGPGWAEAWSRIPGRHRQPGTSGVSTVGDAEKPGDRREHGAARKRNGLTVV